MDNHDRGYFDYNAFHRYVVWSSELDQIGLSLGRDPVLRTEHAVLPCVGGDTSL